MAGNLGCCGYWLADVHIENWRVNILMDSRASSHGGIAHVRVLGIQRCLRRRYWTGCLLTRISPLLQQKQNNGHHDNSHEPLIIAGKPMHQATPRLQVCPCQDRKSTPYTFQRKTDIGGKLEKKIGSDGGTRTH